ncbi:MAG: hypothetical protein ACI8Y8_001023, partial [Planctomycetota bacterium]
VDLARRADDAYSWILGGSATPPGRSLTDLSGS